jgi:hypothetical protein
MAQPAFISTRLGNSNFVSGGGTIPKQNENRNSICFAKSGSKTILLIQRILRICPIQWPTRMLAIAVVGANKHSYITILKFYSK